MRTGRVLFFFFYKFLVFYKNISLLSVKDGKIVKNYDMYYIIDFDEGYVYWFTDGNGDESCDKVKIKSGDLNDKVVITYHNGDDVWSYSLHFKYVNQPSTLIVKDNDGFEYKYTTTDLSSAITKKNSKKIHEY